MMNKITATAFLIFCVVAAAACGSEPAANSNSNANASADLPEGLSSRPIEPGPEPTPGIPAGNNVVTVPSNVSPAEGIPSADELKKPRKPGATPTPGIPSPEELRRQMNRPANNANARP